MFSGGNSQTMKIERIVTTEPGSTEIVAYLDNGIERIVGVSDKCDYPAEVKSRPKVVRSLLNIEQGTSSRKIDEMITEYVRGGKPLFELDVGLVNQLSPDLVVGQTLCNVCAYPLRKDTQGLSIVTSDAISQYTTVDYSPSDFLSIAAEALKISKIIDRTSRAENLRYELKKYYDELRSLGKGHRTAVIEWIDPLYAAGHWVSDLIERSGSKSLIPAGEPGIRIDAERLVKFNPDIIIVAPCGFDIRRTLAEIDTLYNASWWSNLEAVRRGEVYVVDAAYTSRPSPRTVKFAQFLIDIYAGSEPSREICIKLEHLQFRQA